MLIISSEIKKKKIPIKPVSEKLLLKNVPTSTFKIVGFDYKKLYRKSFETSLIISLKERTVPHLAVL